LTSENYRSFAAKDDIFCLFEGALDNLGSLKQQYGLAKSANEVVLVIEAYKALRDRAPYPPNHMVGHLEGNFAFIVFDKVTSTLFVATVSKPTYPFLNWSFLTFRRALRNNVVGDVATGSIC
jgi:asparagine synthetase B (glutamine-hydrolysing)